MCETPKIYMEEHNLIKYLESPILVDASANATRLIGKLKQSVLVGQLYEVSQILRTINFRFVNSKEKLLALENLLYQGACHLLKLEEKVAGQDVATLFLEASAKRLVVYREGNQEAKNQLILTNLNDHANNHSVDWEVCNKVSHIAANLPNTELGRTKFVADSLRVLTPSILNRSLLHNILANQFLQLEDYAEVRYHFLYCANQHNADDISNFLVQYQLTSETKSETDLFITQFILQYLCLQSPLDSPGLAHNTKPNLAPVSAKARHDIKTVADRIFSGYILKHPELNKKAIPFPDLPLLNFTHFILSIIHSNEAETFKLLCDIYKSTWNRDPNYQGYLNRIGALYYGIVDKEKQRQGGGFFNNMLMSLLEGNDGEDEDPSRGTNKFVTGDELD